MKLFNATALVIAVFLVENAFSFAEISATNTTSVPREWKKQNQQWQFSLQPDLYNDSKANIEDTVPGLLLGSSLIYGYAQLRYLVNEYDNATRNGDAAKDQGNFFGFNKKDKPLVNFRNPEYIVTQKNSRPDRGRYLTQKGNQKRGRYLKKDITAFHVLKFLELNRNLLKDENGHIVLDESQGKVNHPRTDFEKELKRHFKLLLRARITEFDDQFNGKELVYGITIDV